MDLQQLKCGACGGNLNVPDGVQFVNCRHCGASLQVHLNASVVYTKVLEAIQQASSQIQYNTEILRLQGQLAELDRRWAETSKSLMIRGRSDEKHVPTKFQAVATLLLTGGVGLVWGNTALSIRAPLSVVSFEVLFLGIGVATSIWTFVSAQRYATAQREYEEQRDLLMEQLRERGM